jgi:hypothetical protein
MVADSERKYDVIANCHDIMLCYFNGFVYRLSFCSQGQHFDIFMDNVDMVYMNIMICWNIIMVMCREGLYLKNKITTAEKRTKLLIIDR